MIEAKGSLTGELNVGTKKEKYTPRHISFYGYKGTSLEEELSNLDVSKLTSMADMFHECRRLTTINLANFTTQNITSMKSMFEYCSTIQSLDLSTFDTSNVTSMEEMFSSCYKLQQLVGLDKFNTSNVTDMTGMFSSCRVVTSIDLSSFNTSKVTHMSQMFSSCSNLTDLDISNFDMSKVDYVYVMFSVCTNLTNLTFGTNLGKGYTTKSTNNTDRTLDLSKSTLLTHDSLMSVINNLYDLNLTYNVANGGTLYRQSLKLGSTNLAKLTADEIAIATDKGWNVS